MGPRKTGSVPRPKASKKGASKAPPKASVKSSATPDKKAPNHPLAKAAADFLAYLKTQRRVSEHTIAAYQRDLERLLSAAAEDGAVLPDSAALRSMLAADSRRGLMPASLSRRLSAWRMFFDYLHRQGLAAANPARGLRAPKKPARLPRALTPDEMTRFLSEDKGKAGNAWTAARDAAIFELLYASGMRVSEMTRLNLADIDTGAGIAVIIRGKGGRGRAAPFGDAAQAALKTWLKIRSSIANKKVQVDPLALFVNARGGRLTARAVQLITAKQAEQTGMRERVSPHVLRHSCASHFLQSSQDLRATQELLGHADISSTQIYTRLDFQNLAKSYESAHPRARQAPRTRRSVGKSRG